MSVKQINFNDYQNTYEQLDLTHAKQYRNLQVIGPYLFSQIALYYNLYRPIWVFFNGEEEGADIFF